MEDWPYSRVFAGFVVCAALVMASGATVAAESTPSEDEEPSQSDYVIGVEDVLRVFVWQEAELSLSLIVRPDGKITVPLVGDIIAAGRTPAQLTAELTRALKEFIKEPVVTVIVEQINHFKVYVLGEVATQGMLQLNKPTRLLQAIAQVGGLSPFASKSDITIVRYEGDRETRVQVDYRRILNGREPDMNIWLRPGDTIIVK